MAIRRSTLGAAAILAVGGPAGLPGQSNYQAWLSLGNTGTLADFLASQKGAPGRDGVDGAGASGTRTAAENITSATFVVDNGDGTCSVADPNDAAHKGRVLGLVILGAGQGQVATFIGQGAAAGVTGTFSATDTTLYIGDGTTGRLGSIVNVSPSLATAAWIQTVGAPASDSSINVLLGEPGAVIRGAVTVPVPTTAVPTSAGLDALTQSIADGLTIAPLSGAPKSIPATVRHPAVLDVTRDLSCPYDGSVADVSAILNDAAQRVKTNSPTGGLVLVNPGIFNLTQTVIGQPGVRFVTRGLGSVQIRRSGDYGPTFKWAGTQAGGFNAFGGIEGFWIFDWDHSMTVANSGRHVVFDYCDRPVIGAMRYENGAGGLGLYSCSGARIGAQDGKFYDYPNNGARTAGRRGIEIDKTSIAGVSFIGGDYCFTDTVEMAGSLTDDVTASLESCIHLGCGDGIRFQGYVHCIYAGTANLRLATTSGKQLSNVGFSNLFSDISASAGILVDGTGYVDGLDIAGKCTTLGSGSGFTATYALNAPAVMNRASIRLTQVTGFSADVPFVLNTGNGDVTLDVPKLRASKPWDLSAPTGPEVFLDVTVPGARAGDDVRPMIVPGNLSGCLLNAYVPNPGNVRVVLSSPTGTAPSLGTVTVYVEVGRRFR